MKRHLLILALCGSAYAGGVCDYWGPVDEYSSGRESFKQLEDMVRQNQINADRQRQEQDDDDDQTEQIEALQAQINAQNSTIIISEGVSRDVQVVTPGHVIDLRK